MEITIQDQTVYADVPSYLRREAMERLRRRLERGNEIKAKGRIQIEGRRYSYETHSGFSIHPEGITVGHFVIYAQSTMDAVRAASVLYERNRSERRIESQGIVQLDGRTIGYRTRHGHYVSAYESLQDEEPAEMG